MKEKILFRSDGNAQMGLGHVFRSLSLIEMLREDYECHLIIKDPHKNLVTRISRICSHIIDLPAEKTWQQEIQHIISNYLTGKEIIILDGYHFNYDYQKAISSKGNPVISIDDIPNKTFCSDVILNHGANIFPQVYKGKAGTIYYLGLDYAILRSAFRNAAKEKRKLPLKNNIFICFGGGDSHNYTLKAVKKSIDFLNPNQINVVTGAAYNHLESLNKYVANSSINIQHHSNLSAIEMANLIKQAKIAICPPSTISYECLSVGIGLFLAMTADNQQAFYDFFIQNNLAKDWSEIGKSINYIQMCNLQKNTLDGDSDIRLKRMVNLQVLSKKIKIRKAQENDLLTYFNWANNPSTRKNSLNSTPIPLEDHTKWFLKKINSSNTTLYIIAYDDSLVGQIRFDLNTKEATISYSLDSEYRGRGLGLLLLAKGIKQLIQEREEIKTIKGIVKKDNIASMKAFKRLGFTSSENELVENAVLFSLKTSSDQC